MGAQTFDLTSRRGEEPKILFDHGGVASPNFLFHLDEVGSPVFSSTTACEEPNFLNRGGVVSPKLFFDHGPQLSI